MTEEASEILKKHRGKCFLVSGRKIVGYGNNWDEAHQMAIQKGIADNEFVTHWVEDFCPNL
jgi:hypothetical protein